MRQGLGNHISLNSRKSFIAFRLKHMVQSPDGVVEYQTCRRSMKIVEMTTKVRWRNQVCSIYANLFKHGHAGREFVLIGEITLWIFSHK